MERGMCKPLVNVPMYQHEGTCAQGNTSGKTHPQAGSEPHTSVAVLRLNVLLITILSSALTPPPAPCVWVWGIQKLEIVRLHETHSAGALEI